MPSNYPDDYDGFPNPNAFTKQNQVSHADQHTNANDAIEAIQHTLGLLPQGSEGTVADRLGDLGDVTDLPEALEMATPGHEFLSIQDGGLVREDVGHLLDRENHTGVVPHGAVGPMPVAKIRSSINQTLKNNAWWPISFDSILIDHGDVLDLNTAATAITSGSNGVALPTGTINVGSTTGFSSVGSIVVIGASAASTAVKVDYTGKTATTFTGCTDGSGNLATGQVVKPSNSIITLSEPGIYLLTGSVGFNANATGRRGIRFVVDVFLAQGEIIVDNTNTVQTLTTSAVIEVTSSSTVLLTAFQNSGGALTLAAEAFNAPTLSIVKLANI